MAASRSGGYGLVFDGGAKSMSHHKRGDTEHVRRAAFLVRAKAIVIDGGEK